MVLGVVVWHWIHLVISNCWLQVLDALLLIVRFDGDALVMGTVCDGFGWW